MTTTKTEPLSPEEETDLRRETGHMRDWDRLFATLDATVQEVERLRAEHEAKMAEWANAVVGYGEAMGAALITETNLRAQLAAAEKERDEAFQGRHDALKLADARSMYLAAEKMDHAATVKERDETQRQSAALREVLSEVRAWRRSGVGLEPQPKTDAETLGARIDAAIASDAGRGWLSPEDRAKVLPQMEVLVQILERTTGLGASRGDVSAALRVTREVVE